MSIIRKFIAFNQRLSLAFDRLLPDRLTVDGNGYFQTYVLPPLIQPDERVYDLGGGSRPYLSPDQKAALNIHVTGLDISGEELSAAPAGAYDRQIVGDLCQFVGQGEADLVICQSTLEHLHDVEGALRAISSSLKPGGRVAFFCPCRNALFARFNIVLPEDLKKRLLFFLFPGKATGHDGFKAYYDKCKPSLIEAISRRHGMQIEMRRLFWKSSYFSVFFPAYLGWRLYQAAMWLLVRDDAAETFCYVLIKDDASVG